MANNFLATLIAVGSVLLSHTAIAEEIHFNCTSNDNGDQYQLVTSSDGITALRFKIKATGEIGYLDSTCARGDALFATPSDNGVRYDDKCSDLSHDPVVQIFGKDPFRAGSEGMPGVINYIHNLKYTSHVEKSVVVTCQKAKH